MRMPLLLLSCVQPAANVIYNYFKRHVEPYANVDLHTWRAQLAHAPPTGDDYFSLCTSIGELFHLSMSAAS